MNDDALLHEILNSYEDSRFPAGFLSEYVMMECFAECNGIDTFLVQNRAGEKFVAKCYDKGIWSVSERDSVLKSLNEVGFPKQVDSFENENMTVTVREFVEGMSLDRYAVENELTVQQTVMIGVQLCDILAALHHRDTPIIHRDIKPQNVIVRPDGNIALIDYDIARIFHEGNETDTSFFGTLSYAPPEQYGFSQTDCRSDIFSLGVLLRYLLTGSPKDNKNIKIYSPLSKIIDKCTAFSPKERFSDVLQVRRALLQANPTSQAIRTAAIVCCALLVAAALAFGGIKVYQRITYTPFTDDLIPAYMSDEDRIADAVQYMKDKYGTEIFDSANEIATIGLLRQVMMELYGLDREYVYGSCPGIPQESNECFLPWGWDDGQTVDRDVMIYAAVKVHDPAIVADWSSLKDDNGFYPGARVAVEFAEKTGISAGVNKPGDICVGEMALLLANADRVFEAASAE